MKYRKIAVTGGIGSGKSLFCKILKELGYVVLNADEIAKQLMKNDLTIRENLVAAFGDDAFTDGTLNKPYLAKIVFNNPDNLKLINSIVHPATITHSKNLIEEYLKNNTIVFYEAALIFEADMTNLFDYIVLITAPEELRIQRILTRDVITADSVQARIKNQMDELIKMSKADYIVNNIGTIEELKVEAGTLVTKILRE